MKELDISQVARRSNLPASTLRYYEEKGLITPTGRRGLRRVYDDDVLDQLAMIVLGQAAGFSLDEITLMFSPDGKPNIQRQMLKAKAEELEEKIRKLSQMAKGLRHAANCPEPSHLECPKFRRLMRVAAKGSFKKQKTFHG